LMVVLVHSMNERFLLSSDLRIIDLIHHPIDSVPPMFLDGAIDSLTRVI
jgi:hypothetical protein